MMKLGRLNRGQNVDFNTTGERSEEPQLFGTDRLDKSNPFLFTEKGGTSL